MGARVDERVYPRMGHTINEDEMAALRALLSQQPAGTALSP
jgi:predicted esterase